MHAGVGGFAKLRLASRPTSRALPWLRAHGRRLKFSPLSSARQQRGITSTPTMWISMRASQRDSDPNPSLHSFRV